jgi:putative RecB family exonuclease
LLLEQRFHLQLGAHRLSGKIDRVDLNGGALEVIDYKLNRELPSQEELDRDSQLGIYLLAVQEMQGRQPEAASRYYLRHNVKISVRKTSDEVERVAYAVAELGDRIESDRKFNPQPGRVCTGCAYRKGCPAASGRHNGPEADWEQGQPSLMGVGAGYVTPQIPGL